MPTDPQPSLSESRRSEIELMIEQHDRTGDPYTGDGAEFLCVYLLKRGVSEAEQEALSR